MPKYVIKHDDAKADKDYAITSGKYRVTTDSYIFEDIIPAIPTVPRTPTTPEIPGTPETYTLIATVRISDIKAVVDFAALDENP